MELTTPDADEVASRFLDWGPRASMQLGRVVYPCFSRLEMRVRSSLEIAR